MRRLLFLALVSSIALGACGDGGPSSDAELTVTATTTHVADLARNVGGARVDVRTILEPSADPHDYEPTPGDARALADSAVVLRSGGEVDEWLDEVVANAGGDAAEVTLIDSVRTIEGGHEHEGEEPHTGDEEHGDEADPHWWQDPRNAILAVRAIRDALIEADPDGRAAYERGAADYVERLRDLDAAIAACMARVPERQRTLVTTHDALGYFAERYGLHVVGAVIPSLSTQAQPSAGDVDRLVEQIRDERVKAIFPETAVNERLERAIARESGAEVAEPLWGDTLGDEGSTGSTYLKAMAFNADAMVRGMTGDRLSCDAGR